MTVQGINLQLPPALYQRLVEVAEASQQPLTDVVDRFRDDLRALNRLVVSLFWVDK